MSSIPSSNVTSFLSLYEHMDFISNNSSQFVDALVAGLNTNPTPVSGPLCQTDDGCGNLTEWERMMKEFQINMNIDWIRWKYAKHYL